MEVGACWELVAKLRVLMSFRDGTYQHRFLQVKRTKPPSRLAPALLCLLPFLSLYDTGLNPEPLEGLAPFSSFLFLVLRQGVTMKPLLS